MIWQEFRLHSILFACRSLITIQLEYFIINNIKYIKLCIILFTMQIADIITEYYNEGDLAKLLK